MVAGMQRKVQVMEARYSTPQELVEALQHRADGARSQLAGLLREPLARLMREFVARQGMPRADERLTLYALHLAETYLRTQPVDRFQGMSWTAFRGAVLMQVAKMAFHPLGKEAGPMTGPAPLPESAGYHSQTLFLPHERIGTYWFGGDWFAGLHAADGSLWVIVADVTGHGYYAHLLASTLPGVWRTCWEKFDLTAPPADLLASMHALLADCLPDGVYVECTLVRLSPEGEATIVPAGGSRLLLRRDQGPPELLKLRGTWLGLSAPTAHDQRTWILAHGDEVLLGTDGMFDHLTEHGGPGLWDRPEHWPGEGTLFDAVGRLLRQALQRAPQKDDITVVLLRRRADLEPALPGAEPSSRNGAGDVPV